MCKREQVKPPIYPPLLIREQCLSLWDRDSSRSDRHCLRSKREGWGEDSKTIEKQEFQSMNNIAHPHPDPPPLRASPCREGGISPADSKKVLSTARRRNAVQGFVSIAINGI